MGIRQIITDDLTGEEVEDGTAPTEVRVDGEDYSVYLGPESKETFIAFLQGEAPLLQVQKRSASSSSSSSSRRGRSKVDTYGYDFNEVRAWAIANKQTAKSGKAISENTRVLNQEIYDAYKQATK